VHMSNILGTINPVDVIVARARQVGALVALDASQSVPHMGVDVQQLGVDFLACTGHKMLPPPGSEFSGPGSTCSRRSRRSSVVAR